MDRSLVQYYQSELAYLRKSGMEFSQKYPKIAEKLDISASVSADPHVERLIESFAFMAGKLQMQIDSQFPEIANTLLSLLYEPLTMPTPSIVMLHFDADMRLVKKAPGTCVKKGTPIYLNSDGEQAVTCTFQTCHDISIWPISLLSTEIISRDDTGVNNLALDSSFYLKLQFKWYGEPNASKSPSVIRLYMNGDHNFKGELFSSLFIENKNTIIIENKNAKTNTPIQEIGIPEHESLLPYNRAVFSGFRLIQEYFAFPDKFYGFDLSLPNDINLSNEFTILVPLTKYINFPQTSNVLLMNAVPAINIFAKTTDPLRLTYQDIGYTLVADSYRNNSTEILAIKKIIGIDQDSNKEHEVLPFFSAAHNCTANTITWYTKRKKSCIVGDDIQIFFVDPNFDPIYPANKFFYAHTLCTNRHLAEQIPAFSICNAEIPLPVKRIYCLNRPTAQIPSINEGSSIWTLISMLSNTFLDDYNIKLKEILHTFSCRYGNRMEKDIDSIVGVNTMKIAKLCNNNAWRGFMRGTAIDIEFDETVSSSYLTLAYILSNFFSVYTSINTFTQLTAITKNMGKKTWDIKTGLHNYL